MKFSLYNKFGALNSPPVFNAFSESIKKQGWKVTEHDDAADVAVIWSVLWNGRMLRNYNVWHAYRGSNRPVVVLEVGALKRNYTWKVAVNGINCFRNYGVNERDNRRRKLFDYVLQPMKQGENIIICCQHERSLQWSNMPPVNTWLDQIITQIREHTQRKIIIRPHPRSKVSYTATHKNVTIVSPVKIQNTYDDYDFIDLLSNAWAVVNWSSNPAVIAAINGIPVFTGSNSLSAPIANLNISEIDTPKLPCREQWYNNITYTEWTVDEIKQGLPLEQIRNLLTPS